MKTIYLTMLFAGLASVGQAETFTGVITDTMCGAKHDMMKNQPDAQCIKMCVKGQDSYALFDGKNVMKLSDQKAPAKFAAQRVKVNGSLNQRTNTIKVASIEPLGGK